MKCSIFRSSLKDFTYIYLPDGSDFDDLPVSLRKVFGEPGRHARAALGVTALPLYAPLEVEFIFELKD